MSRDGAVQSALINSGLHLLNEDAAAKPQRTLIVLGVARSGTTMIAGALQKLGVDMMAGGKPNAVFEDVELGEAVEARDHSRISGLVEARDCRAAVWGWKRPSAIGYMARVEHHFRQPRYVVVFRDLLAIASRNRISVQSDLLENLDETFAHYRRLLAFVGKCRRPVMLVSYEKAMLNPRAFVDALSRFAGDHAPESRAAAEAFIQANPDAYLVSARNWRVQGELSSIEEGRVMGWAFAPGQREPLTVRLTINGELFGTQVADLPRPPLVERKLHPTGCCGFNFRLPKFKWLSKGDRVSVGVVGELQDLRFSPQRFGDHAGAWAKPHSS